MKVKQRDIILINFPFSDLTGAKIRPALVISNDKYNQKNLDVLVLVITSNLSAHNYKLFIENKDLEIGILPVKSAIRIDKPFSVFQGKILKVQAKIKLEKLQEVKMMIVNLIE